VPPKYLLYLPAGQATQGAFPEPPYLPAGQIEQLPDIRPEALLLPAGHALQNCTPSSLGGKFPRLQYLLQAEYILPALNVRQ